MSESAADRTIQAFDEDATRALAAEMATRSKPGSVIALIGPLGSGKTTFVKAFVEARGIEGDVTSPTFVRLNVYEGDPTVYHLDLYRVESPEEAVKLALDEWLDTDGITLVEWADRAAGLFPDQSVTVTLEYGDTPESRVITVSHAPPNFRQQG
jgi:tRNA threonylcarbamoyladenosine biosynthesis protein TsaE